MPSSSVTSASDAHDRPPLTQDEISARVVYPGPVHGRRGRVRTWTSLYRLLGRSIQPYRWRFLTMGIVSLVTVLFGMSLPLVTRAVIDGPVTHGDVRGVWLLGALALGLGVTEAVLLFVRRYLVSWAGLSLETDIRRALYAKLQRLPMSFHARWESGQLLSRMMTDLSMLRRFINFGLTFLVVNAIQIVVVIVLLVRMYPPLGLVVLVSVVPIIWFCAVMERRFTRVSRAVQDRTGDVASAADETARSIRVIRAFGRRDHVQATFSARTDDLYEAAMRRTRTAATFWTFLEVIPTATLVVVVALGAWAAATGAMTIGTLVAFLALMVSLVTPISMTGILLSMMQEAMTAADRIVEVFDTHNPITSAEHPRAGERRGHLELRGVSFRFGDADADTLHDLWLDVAPGETVAIAGGTGSGKTTLTSLFPRLEDVTAGQILLDGVDLREHSLDELRSRVATAFEEPTLFSMSARENLTLGRPDATDAEIERALDIARAGFVRELPWGLETRIGEQGLALSGGQRQRLALARAVITDPAVLVLDDTLSALDVHTEAEVERALKEVLGHMTGILVAHRASTVMLADRVALLREGRIVAVGTHADLLATNPEYRSLLSADFDAEAGCDDLEEAR